MERGENPEDLYYLCTIKGHYYVVFETDYIMNTLTDIAREASDIFKGYDLSPVHWLVKKDFQATVGATTVPVDTDGIDELRKNLISDEDDATFDYAVRHAVIEFVSTKSHIQHRFDPNTYSRTQLN
jgi:hypothetical protein